jgi:hypothetical protein
MNIPDLSIATSSNDLNNFAYPSKGLAEKTGCYDLVQVSSTSASNFPRINSFSACKTSKNMCLVAVSSISTNFASMAAESEEEIQTLQSSKIYVIYSQLGEHFSTNVRKARVIQTGTACDNGIDVVVDSDVFSDVGANFVWIVDGNFASRKLYISQRIEPNVWRLQFADGEVFEPELGTCFSYIAFCKNVNNSIPAINKISPLPYITVNGEIVTALNPQIISNDKAALNATEYAYIVAEAPVNGNYQLFLYSFSLDSDYSAFGWKQLTFNGENKNAKLSFDKFNNLQLTWESSRCGVEQVMYGIIGSNSRGLANEVFISAIDKQCGLVEKMRYYATVDITGAVGWFNNGDSLPAGDYKIYYVEGGYRSSSTGGWIATANLVDSLENTIVSAPYIQPPVPSADGTYDNGWESLEDCETANFGQSKSFSHTGGPIGLKFTDSDYLNNTDGDRSLSFAIVLDVVSSNLNEGLVTIEEPTALNLRDRDSYSQEPVGNFWTNFTSNGGVTNIISDSSINVSGNPSTKKFSAFATISRDEEDRLLDGNFSQLSFQVSFNLDISSTDDFSSTLTDYDIKDLYEVFRRSFNPYETSSNGLNTYTKSGNYYTIGNYEYYYDNIIPIAGSYRGDNLSQEQVRLRHFMLAIVPEKVRFLATNTRTQSQHGAGYVRFVEETYYTGYYKLALVTETAGNIEDHKLIGQRYHWVRYLGDRISGDESHSFKAAVHYAKLRSEQVASRQKYDAESLYPQDVRFTGNIIIAVDDKVVGTDNFIPDFADGYYNFDIGIGCPFVGEYRSPNIKPFENSINENINITMNYDNIAIGPHSIIPNKHLVTLAKSDRNVTKMLISSLTDEIESSDSTDETWNTENVYNLTLGLNRNKIKLNQIPITFKNTNKNPSIALDDCSRAFISYQSNRDDRWEIYYTGFDDLVNPFRFDTRITDNKSNSLMPSIGIEKNGRKVIAWHDDRDGVFQIYAARNTTTKQCGANTCTIDDISDNMPDVFQEYFDEYNLADPYDSEICRFRFTFTNEELVSRRFHFRLNFYTDPSHSLIYTYVDSRYDISNWFAESSEYGDFAPIGYDGVYLSPGETIEIQYDPSKEDDLYNRVLFVTIESDDGAVVDLIDNAYVYFCPTQQSPICSIPCLYTNYSGNTKNVDFRVSVYRDELLSDSVFTSSTALTTNKWIAGDRVAFPSGGMTVPAGHTVNATFNPDFLPFNESADHASSSLYNLLCGVTYWVKVESYVSGVYTEEDVFALKCNCQDINSEIKEDVNSAEWLCSGQGSMDLRITKTQSNAMFPSCFGSCDEAIYIAWEDHRFNSSTSPVPYAYWTVWDASTDIFYSSGQGYHDRQAGTSLSLKPVMLVSNMQYPAIVYQTDSKIYQKTCSLYISSNESELDSSVASLFNTDLIDGLNENCIAMKVNKRSEVEKYSNGLNDYISLVSNCLIYLDITGPNGCEAVRFKNSISDEWSGWISIRPLIPQLSSSSSNSFGATMQAYFFANNQFTAPWVLSGGSGSKTVYCQILTHSGIANTSPLTLIAKFDEIKYKVNFYLDESRTVAASTYNGLTVVSKNGITVNKNNLDSINDELVDSSKIYISVQFDDPDNLSKLLELNTLDSIGLSTDLTFNVITEGKNQLNLALTDQNNGLYYGEFNIYENDDIDNIDGLAVVTINIPYACSLSSSSSGCNDYLTPTIVKQILSDQNENLTLEKFKMLYSDSSLCSFNSKACSDGIDVNRDSFDTDVYTPPTVNGPAICDPVTWIVPQIGEYGFYLDSTKNAKDWVLYSPEYEIDISDTRTDYMSFPFASNSSLDDLLFLLKPDETISYSVNNGTSSSSSACSFGGVQSALQVTFTLPANVGIFKNNSGYYCHGPTGCNNGSVKKLFLVSSNTYTISAGTTTNNGTGNSSTVFTNIGTANGKTESPLLSSSSSSSTVNGAIKIDFTNGISKSELDARGFVSSNGKVRFKLAFIPSGYGSVNLSVSCGASCDLSSSSSG